MVHVGLFLERTVHPKSKIFFFFFPLIVLEILTVEVPAFSQTYWGLRLFTEILTW